MCGGSRLCAVVYERLSEKVDGKGFKICYGHVRQMSMKVYIKKDSIKIEVDICSTHFSVLKYQQIKNRFSSLPLLNGWCFLLNNTYNRDPS